MGPGVSGTPPVSGRGRRAVLTTANLAAGKVSGEEVYSNAVSFTRRTYWCSYRGQWSSGASSPAPMAAWWCGTTPAGQLRLRGGARSGWRALPRQCGAGARGKRERGEAERRGPGSAAFRRGGAHSDERLARKGSSPRLTEVSTGCARWRRSCWRRESGNGVAVRELDADGAHRRVR